jgi:hypothetical protein
VIQNTTQYCAQPWRRVLKNGPPRGARHFRAAGDGKHLFWRWARRVVGELRSFCESSIYTFFFKIRAAAPDFINKKILPHQFPPLPRLTHQGTLWASSLKWDKFTPIYLPRGGLCGRNFSINLKKKKIKENERRPRDVQIRQVECWTPMTYISIETMIF